jgi:hypothetical protein
MALEVDANAVVMQLREFRSVGGLHPLCASGIFWVYSRDCLGIWGSRWMKVNCIYCTYYHFRML